MLLLAAACGSGGGPGGPMPDSSQIDSANGTDGGTDAAAVGLPTWMLEDVQPVSPLFGQTYGVDTFAGKIIVVTLLEGF
jgi:hypothetical protein